LPAVTVIHGALLVACHAQPAATRTVTLRLLPAARTTCAAGKSFAAHPEGAGGATAAADPDPADRGVEAGGVGAGGLEPLAQPTAAINAIAAARALDTV